MQDSAIVNVESTMQPEGRPPEGQVDQSSTDKIFQDRFNQLARRERSLRQQEGQFKSMQEKLTDYESKFSRLKESPIDSLESDFGLKYDELLVKGLNNDPTAKLAQKIEQLEARLKEKDAYEKEQSESSRKSDSITSIREQLADKDDFDLVNSFGAHNQVYDKIYAHYKETGETLDVNEVAKEIEEDIRGKLSFLTKSKKISNIFAEHLKTREASTMESLEEKFEQKQAQSSQPGFTLSNDLTANSTPEKQYTSEQDRVKAAIERFKRLQNN